MDSIPARPVRLLTGLPYGSVALMSFCLSCASSTVLRSSRTTVELDLMYHVHGYTYLPVRVPCLCNLCHLNVMMKSPVDYSSLTSSISNHRVNPYLLDDHIDIPNISSLMSNPSFLVISQSSFSCNCASPVHASSDIAPHLVLQYWLGGASLISVACCVSTTNVFPIQHLAIHEQCMSSNSSIIFCSFRHPVDPWPIRRDQ